MATAKRIAASMVGSAMMLGGLLGAVNVAHAATLTSTDVQPASLVAGSTNQVTITFTTTTTIPNDGRVEVTFPSGFNVTGATAGACPSMDGTFTTAVSGQTVRIVRQANGTGQTAAVENCTVNGIVNPTVAGSTGTYSIQTMNSVPSVLDDNNAVAADVILAATLTSTNVQPASLRTATTNTATVSFTTVNSLANNGKIKITFPSGFDVSGANGGACSTMDGSFTTSVASQVVTLTRSGGTTETPGAQTCTIGGIKNPATAGTNAAYTIATTNSSDATHDQDTAVSADTFTAGGSLSPGDSTESTPKTYTISVSLPEATAVYMPGDDIAVSWTTGGTGTTGFVNLYYSVDGGLTWETIATNEVNDNAYTWTAPDISEQDVIIRVSGTDLVTALSTDDSDAFSIGTNDEADEEEETDEESSEGESEDLLPDGTYMIGESWDTVYYIEDGYRRPFLDSQTFFTYQDDFDAVVEVEDEELAWYTIGSPMLPKAGTVLVKIQSVNSVYALVDEDGVATLRWITSESVANDIYGASWSQFVIDVPVTAWGHFAHGDDIDSASELDVDLGDMQTRDALNSK